jgi:hypothetical protein
MLACPMSVRGLLLVCPIFDCGVLVMCRWSFCVAGAWIYSAAAVRSELL